MFNREMTGLWRWNLFWWKVEGKEPLNGLNVYHPDDPISAGFVIRVWRFGFKVRYSKRAKKWVIGAQKYSFQDTWLPFNWKLDLTIGKDETKDSK